MTESDNIDILTVNLGETSSDLSVQTTRFYICLWRTRNIQSRTCECYHWGFQQPQHIMRLPSEQWRRRSSRGMGRGTPSRPNIHDAKLPPSFNSCRWSRGYNPDLTFTSDLITCQCKKQVLEPIPHSQHRPITIAISAAVVTQKGPAETTLQLPKS